MSYIVTFKDIIKDHNTSDKKGDSALTIARTVILGLPDDGSEQQQYTPETSQLTDNIIVLDDKKHKNIAVDADTLVVMGHTTDGQPGSIGSYQDARRFAKALVKKLPPESNQKLKHIYFIACAAGELNNVDPNLLQLTREELNKRGFSNVITHGAMNLPGKDKGLTVALNMDGTLSAFTRQEGTKRVKIDNLFHKKPILVELSKTENTDAAPAQLADVKQEHLRQRQAHFANVFLNDAKASSHDNEDFMAQAYNFAYRFMENESQHPFAHLRGSFIKDSSSEQSESLDSSPETNNPSPKKTLKSLGGKISQGFKKAANLGKSTFGDFLRDNINAEFIQQYWLVSTELGSEKDITNRERLVAAIDVVAAKTIKKLVKETQKLEKFETNLQALKNSITNDKTRSPIDIIEQAQNEHRNFQVKSPTATPKATSQNTQPSILSFAEFLDRTLTDKYIEKHWYKPADEEAPAPVVPEKKSVEKDKGEDTTQNKSNTNSPANDNNNNSNHFAKDSPLNAKPPTNKAEKLTAQQKQKYADAIEKAYNTLRNANSAKMNHPIFHMQRHARKSQLKDLKLQLTATDNLLTNKNVINLYKNVIKKIDKEDNRLTSALKQVLTKEIRRLSDGDENVIPDLTYKP